jgi:uncharacterized Ntn-hydrolase superfamily protein
MTFSIVARCAKTLALGVAVSTAVPAVGNRVPHVEAGVGAIATQANTNISYGIKGLRLLKRDCCPQIALEAMLEEDPRRETRQVIIIDRKGRVAAFTGKNTVAWKGHFVGRDFAVTGNMLAGKRFLEAMREVFEDSEGDLSERLLKALEAGEEAGGDRRGRLSAALVMRSKREKYYPSLNLRVDFSPSPVKELRKIFENCKRQANNTR